MSKLIEITGKPISGEWGSDDLAGTGIPVLRTTNFTNEGIVNYSNIVTRQIKKKNIAEKMLRYGDIILEKSGGSDNQPVGRVVFFEGEENKYLFNNFTGVLRIQDTNKWHPKYVFYALFTSYVSGGTVCYENRTTGLHNLRTDSYVSSVEIPDRTIDEQIAIVEHIDTIVKIIRLYKDQVSNLDVLVKSRFIELFGDPLIEDDRYPRVPLGSLAEVGSSKRIFEKEYVSEGIPFYRTKEIVELSKGNRITTELFITKERYDEIRSEYGVPQKGDLLISAVGTIGVIWIVDGKNDFYFKDGNLLRVSATEKFVPEYLKHLLEALISAYKSEMSSGTAYAALTISALKEMMVYDVPYAEQKQFATFVTQTDKSKVVIQKALDEAQLLFDSLMQKYFG